MKLKLDNQYQISVHTLTQSTYIRTQASNVRFSRIKSIEEMYLNTHLTSTNLLNLTGRTVQKDYRKKAYQLVSL